MNDSSKGLVIWLLMVVLLGLNGVLWLKLANLSQHVDANGTVVHAMGTDPAERAMARAMTRLQQFVQKLSLSLDAHDAQQAGFYYAETLEELSDLVEEVPEYADYPVSRLASEHVAAPMDALGAHLRAERWDVASEAFRNVIAGCNACHAAMGREFIRLVPSAPNPFNQAFGD